LKQAQLRRSPQHRSRNASRFPTIGSGLGERFADWTWYPELLARPVPRYTSYPTAAEFADVDGRGPAAALARCRGRSRSICISPIARKSAGIAAATPGRPTAASACPPISALHREIELVAQAIGPQAGSPASPLAGSPNAISPTDFVRLIDTLTLNFRLARPVLSLELDPRSLAPQWFTAFAAWG
jgi:oxygen-independent coproporphyrinogen-3 oxidase